MISRRSGLCGFALLLLARRPATADDEGLASMLADSAAARAIGAAYLRAYPLVVRELAHLRLLSRAEAIARVRDDFAAGRVATVNRWMLSQTEARLCALVHLAGGVQRPAGPG